MAILATVETTYGEERSLYIRLNNFEQLANHAVAAEARFRGFVSREAFEAGKAYVFERIVTFDADVSEPVWAQAYDALKLEVAGTDV